MATQALMALITMVLRLPGFQLCKAASTGPMEAAGTGAGPWPCAPTTWSRQANVPCRALVPWRCLSVEARLCAWTARELRWRNVASFTRYAWLRWQTKPMNERPCDMLHAFCSMRRHLWRFARVVALRWAALAGWRDQHVLRSTALIICWRRHHQPRSSRMHRQWVGHGHHQHVLHSLGPENT